MFTEFLNITPKVEFLPDYDLKPETSCYGIKALCFEGAEYKGKKTKVFCHIGYPKGGKETKVPAIILVHGGGGHAYAEWVKIWNERGYAAIAIDLCGCLPAKNQKGLVYTEWQRDEYFERWEDKDSFVAGPNDYLILDENKAIENVWFYSAIANTILAHNLLLADSRIDSAKIGITGVSWGGTITSQVIAYDRRFAFAIPIYGSGFLHHSFTKVNKQFKLSDSIKYWDISFKYPEIEFPVLWLCWNYDHCFDVLPNCYSYMDGTATYAARTAYALNANYNAFAFSSIGVTVDASSTGSGESNIRKYFPSLKKNASADYVVINLGTNDCAKYQKAGLAEQQVKDGFATFAREVREYYANSTIIFAYGMMTDGADIFVESAVNALLEDGDKKVYSIKLSRGTSGNAGHPNNAEQLVAANELTAFITELEIKPDHTPGVLPMMVKSILTIWWF